VAAGEQTRVMLVTGAGSGIGQATTRLALERGHAVAAVDFDEEGLARTAELVGDSDRLLKCTADVTDAAAVTTAVEAAVARFGHLQVLIGAAALGITGRIDETEPALWDRIIDVTLKGSSICCRAVIPYSSATCSV
jgi:NAD(P)-dependent dehydrogenase (short-subunit alcohol dehydrogenase family)